MSTAAAAGHRPLKVYGREKKDGESKSTHRETSQQSYESFKPQVLFQVCIKKKKEERTRVRGGGGI